MAEHPRTILEPGGTEVPTAAGGARRYRKPLRKFRWRDVRDILEDSVAEWGKHNAPRLGAALSFYTLLSLAPLLLVTVSVAGLVMGRDAAATGVISQLRTLGGVELARAAEALLSGPRSAAHGIIATLFGLVTLLFGASGVMVELREALNYIWDVPQPELNGMKRALSFVKDRLFSFALVLSVGFLLVVSLAVSAWIAALGALSAYYLPANEALLHAANLILSFVVITALFAAIYKFLPNARIEWRDVILGGAVTSILFSLGKLGLGIYLGKAAFASAYGAAASVVALIVWVYYSAQIFFLGAEFTHMFANRHGSRPAYHPEGMVVESDRGMPPSAPKIVTPSEAAQEKTTPGVR
jgi:membrane protein